MLLWYSYSPFYSVIYHYSVGPEYVCFVVSVPTPNLRHIGRYSSNHFYHVVALYIFVTLLTSNHYVLVLYIRVKLLKRNIEVRLFFGVCEVYSSTSGCSAKQVYYSVWSILILNSVISLFKIYINHSDLPNFLLIEQLIEFMNLSLNSSESITWYSILDVSSLKNSCIEKL